MKRLAITAGCYLLLAGCDTADVSHVNPPAMTSAEQVAVTSVVNTARINNEAPAAPEDLNRPLWGARDNEVVNPDDSIMVLLYFDVAGMTPPLDAWIERDIRVWSAQGPDKAAMRSIVRQEIQAGINAVAGVGRIRISLPNAGLSRYDPTYGEFIVGALSPSRGLRFTAFGRNVNLKYGNGRTAQIWRVPPTEAQAIEDRVGGRSVRIDVLLRITGVQPEMNDGSLVADVVEFELRDFYDGTMIGRAQAVERSSHSP